MDMTSKNDIVYPLDPAARRIEGEMRSKVVADLAAWYKAGASIRQIAEHAGRSYGFAHHALVEARVKMRERGSARRR